MPLLVCPICEIEMRPSKQGVPVEGMYPFGSCELFMADLYTCPTCDREVLAGSGPGPIVDRDQPDYLQQVEDARKYSGIRKLYRFWRNTYERKRFDHFDHERSLPK